MRTGSCMLLLYLISFLPIPAVAQEFFNLTAEQVRIDSLLPRFSHSYALGEHYADSTYTFRIEYPEFIDMSEGDIERYRAITNDAPLPELPVVEQFIGVSRRQGTLVASFVPLVYRDGKYQKLVSFRLKRLSSLTPNPSPIGEGSEYSQGGEQAKENIAAEEVQAARLYTPLSNRRGAGGEAVGGQAVGGEASSVLASGQWAKISVPETGIYQITEALVRQCGFSNINKVKIYGYGGALQPDRLERSYLEATDDLPEVATCTVNGRRLFHAVGPVGWSSASATIRTRNPYADYGCYFLTENDDEPLTVDSATFVGSFYPTTNDYHSLYEVDDFAWYHSGRKLYDATPIESSTANIYDLEAHGSSGRLTIAMTCAGPIEATVTLNDSVVGTLQSQSTLSGSGHDLAIERSWTFTLTDALKARNKIGIQKTATSAEMHLDYIVLTQSEPKPLPDLSTTTFPAPQFVYRITNQNHHADPQADMVIIIPTTQKLLAQAQRLKQLHESGDGMRVNIVPADELYNEFSSGTPDANAYRRYLKMLYDRAESEADMPRHLLLFGDGAWDNRMLSSNWRNYSPDDFLLCYESENSLSQTNSYVAEDFFCMLDDGEGANVASTDIADISVGRISARTAEQAKIVVDKIENYYNNTYAGDWQNTLVYMGDDGNSRSDANLHMKAANAAAAEAEQTESGFIVRRIMWDAYTRVSSSTGMQYPDVERIIKQQMKDGALLFDYCGHGAPYSISHEKVLLLADFEVPTTQRMPLWITASCDIAPFDTHEENIGESAMFNARGGAVAFLGTTRTVLTNYNEEINTLFNRFVLSKTDGRPNTMGEALRLAKNELKLSRDESGHNTYSGASAINKLHFVLLGDPALALAAPTKRIVVDSINGQSVLTEVQTAGAGTRVTVAGHIADASDFNGVVTMTVRDVEENIVCRMNDDNIYERAFEFTDRPSIIYNGSDSVRNGQFTISFAVPRDISYSEATSLITLYAISDDRTQKAHGETANFAMSNSATVANDGIGPSIYCYLNSSAFVNGGSVNTTPYFFAELTDKEGINAAGSGVGHDLELTIDGQMSMTYNLNNYFQYSFGDYRSGTVGYTLPELSEGEHTLVFRAWDVLNNSSVAELKFRVEKGQRPQCFSIACTRNPATTSTSFVLNHDRVGSTMNAILEVFDTSGRQLWRHVESGVPTDNTYTIDWDLTVDSGSRLHTGVYLYRVVIECEGSTVASPAKKLIILNH